MYLNSKKATIFMGGSTKDGDGEDKNKADKKKNRKKTNPDFDVNKLSLKELVTKYDPDKRKIVEQDVQEASEDKKPPKIISNDVKDPLINEEFYSVENTLLKKFEQYSIAVMKTASGVHESGDFQNMYKGRYNDFYFDIIVGFFFECGTTSVRVEISNASRDLNTDYGHKEFLRTVYMAQNYVMQEVFDYYINKKKDSRCKDTDIEMDFDMFDEEGNNVYDEFTPEGTIDEDTLKRYYHYNNANGGEKELRLDILTRMTVDFYDVIGDEEFTAQLMALEKPKKKFVDYITKKISDLGKE
jgi:hypothetical protein